MVAFAFSSRKIIVVLLSNQNQVLVVYLKLLLPSYIVFWIRDSLVSKQLCNHLLDQLKVFECFHMFLNRFFFSGWWVLCLNHNILIFYLYIWSLLSSNDKTKSLFTHWKSFDKLSNPNIGFVFVLFLFIDVYSS